MTQNISIREAEISDLEEIWKIERASFSHPYSKKFLKYLLCEGGDLHLVAENSEGWIIGYASVRIEADRGHLVSIAVHPQTRREGIGTQLIENVQKKIKKQCKGLFLEVRESNQGAQKFYQKLGFKKEGRKENYYETGEDAIIYSILF